jgi:hypothetical protein
MNLDQLLPQVQKLISDKTLKVLSNEGPKVAFKGLYNVLPGAFRLFIKEEAFINFCLSHQEKLFPKSKIPPKKTPAKKATVKKAKAPTKSASKKVAPKKVNTTKKR